MQCLPSLGEAGLDGVDCLRGGDETVEVLCLLSHVRSEVRGPLYHVEEAAEQRC